MPETTFSLHSYRGPAQINGVDFAHVTISEHADSGVDTVIKGWEGSAKVSKTDAPTITPEWMENTARKTVIEVQLPDGGTGQAYPTGAAHVQDGSLEYWTIDFTGIGPSPWDGGV
ncbi:hypothetical protein ABZ784_29005 [Streptomyces tendae]|uniref:hypothetical protein n=1 Tax=Streptomyces tendae TaxID=1932 RepID=UPI003406E600